MEMQFNKTVYPCLRKVADQTLTQELTQELKLTEGMPDIGRILGCWGQILIRGKEWLSGGMNVSGGIMAWVLYAPEDGSAVQSTETWIPFQLKWNLPETQHDGIIHVRPYLKSMDCRSTAARKLMLRAGIAVTGEATEPEAVEVYLPVSVPEDLQLLRQTYPMELPQEAGEKPFQIDEEFSIPGAGKIIRYEVWPEITEHKVMAGRLVFRGICRVHMLYEMADGGLACWDTEAAYSQFTDLDRDYGPNSAANMNVILTGTEVDMDESGKIQFKCGLSGQYVVFDRMMIEVVEDAYSPYRTVNAEITELTFPVRLDSLTDEIPYSQNISAEGQKIIDSTVFLGNPTVTVNGDVMESEMQSQYHALYMDENGNLQSATARGEVKWEMLSDSDNVGKINVVPRRPMASFDSEGISMSGTVKVSTSVFADKGIPMITALEMGEAVEPDPQRPSLILRRTGHKGLWDLAKESGSTVDVICKANKLQEEPLDDRLLLIPVF